jgi:hypothetical protein
MLLSGLVIALLSPTILSMAQPAAIYADPLGSQVTVVLDDLTPVIPAPGDTLRISGRLVNTSGTSIDQVSIRLGLSAGPLESRSSITEIAELALVPEKDPIDYFLDRTLVEIPGPLRAGDERSFLIQEPFDSLPLGKDGVYSIMVEVLGATAGNTGLVRIGGSRTFLPWVTSEIDPISLVWLWPLADYPAREADGVFLNENTPQSLALGGRLDNLLTIGANNPSKVTWIADPELLQSATDIASGYQVRVTDTNAGDSGNVSGNDESEDRNQVAVGDLSASAGNWLTRLNAALAAATPGSKDSVSDRLPLRVMPYADVDASALERAQMDVDLVRATTMAPAVASTILGSSISGTVYWAPFGRLNSKTADVLASSGVRTVIVNSSALPAVNTDIPSTGLGVIGTTFGAMNAVLIDSRLTNTLGLSQNSRSQSIELRQRFLAETLLASQLVPADALSRFMVVGPANIRWNPNKTTLNELLSATGTAPWLKSATLTDLLEEGATTTARKRGGYGPRAKDSELTPQYLTQVQRASTQLASLTAILDNPSGFSDSYAEAILRTESAAWRDDPETGLELLRSVRAGLSEQISQVYALSSGTITLSGDEGLVPVTIANDLDRAVTVGVQLRGSPSARLISDPLFGITIEPGKKVSVELNAQVVGGRALNTDVQLLTPDGQNFGSPAQIQLESTAYAQAAAWVIAAAFIAIIVFVVVGVTRRIHRATQGGQNV